MSKEASSGAAPTLSIGRAAAILGDLYAKTIRSGASLKKLPPVMLWGPPGIGKSQGIRQITGHTADRRTSRCRDRQKDGD